MLKIKELGIIIGIAIAIFLVGLILYKIKEKRREEEDAEEMKKYFSNDNIKGKRFKESHTIDFKVIKKKKINLEDYERFIISENNSIEGIKKDIKDYVDIEIEEGIDLDGLELKKINDIDVIKISENINLNFYHNMVGWIGWGNEKNKNIIYPIGFARNRDDIEENYLFQIDLKNKYGDTIVGFFKNGENFEIYLPDAFKNEVKILDYEPEIVKDLKKLKLNLDLKNI